MSSRSYCTTGRDCEQESILFRKVYGCFKKHGICRPCTSKKPGDVGNGCSDRRGFNWTTAVTTLSHSQYGDDDDDTTTSHDSLDKFVSSVSSLIILFVVIAIIAGVMYCMGCCPEQKRTRERERERPVYNNDGIIENPVYAGYPAVYIGGQQYILVPTPYQTQFAVITSPPPLYSTDKGPKKQEDIPAPKPPNQNAVVPAPVPAPAPAPAAPKSDNNAQDIVIRLKVEVPEKSQGAA